ncbi:hypothetical protein UlMin_003339 [Ulmus minor]
METHNLIYIFYAIISLSILLKFSFALDTLFPNQSLIDDNTRTITLVSSGENFELGFFSPGKSKNRYLGIWYKSTPDVVAWVANRNTPLTDSYGEFTFNNQTNQLVLLNQSKKIVWSSNSSQRVTNNPVAQLLDSGNLVLRESESSSSELYLWQSFDYPTDTLLEGMKLGLDLNTGFERHLTSWKSSDDPSAGDFTYKMIINELPQLVLTRGSTRVFRTGTWNGVRFSGHDIITETGYKFGYLFSENEASFTFESTVNSVLSRLTASPTGFIQRLIMHKGSREWDCKTYNYCGPNSICTVNGSNPICQCLQGFVPMSPEEWKELNMSNGCRRKTPLNCEKGDGFVKLDGVKLPDMLEFWLNKNMSLEECKELCLKNCSCKAYANSDVRNGGSGCLMWFGNLIDVQGVINSEQDMYIRLSSSEIKKLAKVILQFAALLIFLTSLLCKDDDIELPLFDFATIITATNNFSPANKIGLGGFGPVYKGNLLSGQEIAVKRLSKDSVQGRKEFMNEVELISKLQHKNLVALLGCCVQGEEKMLIYEYMPNKSLDYFIFDHKRSNVLSWEKNFDIIMGIARGLLYIHQDSKLQIIHRDLKASNILLDINLNPKISDFGLARICAGNENETQTRRVIGTYFGVLLLEIVSGKSNTKFSHPNHYHNLLGHAWLLWKDGKALELMDVSDRPTMSSVVLMLANVGLKLPWPKEPGFFIERSSTPEECSTSESHTKNVITVTIPIDTLFPNQSLIDDNTKTITLVSSGENFELGFFSPGKSNNGYLGIWYKSTPDVVAWVSNRNTPLTDSYGEFTFNNKTNQLVLLNQSKKIVWSSNSSKRVTNTPVAQLLDSGNLVLRESGSSSSELYLWQSFDYPTDTLLGGMKLGLDLNTGFERHLTSWKSSDDPSAGDFTYKMSINGLPQLVLTRGSTRVFRTGTWNGVRFSGHDIITETVFKFVYLFSENEASFTFESTVNSVLSRVTVSPTGFLQSLIMHKGSREWDMMYTGPSDQQCKTYKYCGPNSIRTVNGLNPVCQCLQGFVPMSPEEWKELNMSNGCRRKTPLNCEKGDGFVKLDGVKLPDMLEFWLNKNMSLEECKGLCLKNCSCKAYANSDVRNGGSGCLMWFGNLIDVQGVINSEQDMYIRLSSSEINQSKDEEIELPLYDFATIITATNNFSPANKIGLGGFGLVYKGNLLSGQEIAVKILSKDSVQGRKEFMNEVELISKLQHKNLVALLGCCIQGGEKMLIYEYMPNKSLDYFIFDHKRSNVLSWEKNFDIIMGIARGLLYIHQDSKLQIIHRDLKASNILLDINLNPKISDFGLARICAGNENETRTRRVIGTYGYMSPEYAVEGKFSLKSDIFSFGVLLLEIVSGKSNTKFSHPNHYHNLLGHAWLLWKDGKALELMDVCFKDSGFESQVVRCIHVGLLCVQKFSVDRPTMSSVVLMLANVGLKLPWPKEPGFFIERSSTPEECSTSESHTENVITVTIPIGR